jgi:hypothetical protein
VRLRIATVTAAYRIISRFISAGLAASAVLGAMGACSKRTDSPRHLIPGTHVHRVGSALVAKRLIDSADQLLTTGGPFADRPVLSPYPKADRQ